ncbi:hypothetical protein AAHC03_020764 [Spirometra sp. Aus1]
MHLRTYRKRRGAKEQVYVRHIRDQPRLSVLVADTAPTIPPSPPPLSESDHLVEVRVQPARSASELDVSSCLKLHDTADFMVDRTQRLNPTTRVPSDFVI